MKKKIVTVFSSIYCFTLIFGKVQALEDYLDINKSAVVMEEEKVLSGDSEYKPKVLEIVKNDNPILREKCIEVDNIDEEICTLIDDMKLTMEENGGVGIAAPQVGKNIRLFLVKYGDSVKEYINPEIDFCEGSQISIEGCLSLPKICGIVKRPSHIKGKAYNKCGEQFTFDISGEEATIVCHENDHLDGILFTDITKFKFDVSKLSLNPDSIYEFIVENLNNGYDEFMSKLSDIFSNISDIYSDVT